MQYFDMVRDVGAATRGATLLMTHSPSAVNKVCVWLGFIFGFFRFGV
jgi:hypothetical protein